MNFTLVLLVVAAVLGCVLGCTEQDFKDFQVKYEKNYPSQEEELSRMESFCKTFDQINEFNKLSLERGYTFTRSIDRFSDMTEQEITNYNLGLDD